MKDLRVMMGTSRIRLAILVSMAIGFGLPASQAASNAWKTYGDVGVVTNDWNNPNNWTNSASFPNAVDDVAVISGNIWTHGCFIALNQQITVGSLATGDTAGGEKFSFTPGTSGSLVFQAANGNAALTHIAGGTGQDTFTCPLILSNTLQVSVLSSAPGDYAFNASVSGNGGIIKNGPGVLWLGVANSFAGDLVVSNGMVVLQNGASMPSGAGKGNVFVGAGAILSPNAVVTINGLSGAGTITIAQSWVTGSQMVNIGANDQTSVFSGVISNGYGTVGITKTGAGSLTLTGTNSYTGTTTINQGTLQFAKELSLYNNTSANWTKANISVLSGATLALNVGGTGEFTAGDLDTLQTNLKTSINNNGLRAGSALGLDTSNAGGSFTYNTAITNSTGTGGGAVGLTKLGTGTLILGGDNTYSGPTTVSNGTLNVSGDYKGSGAVMINAGGALINGAKSGTGVLTVSSGYLGGTGTVAGVVTNYATVTAGDTNTVGTLTVSNLVMAANSTSLVNFDSTSCDRIAVTGTLTLPSLPNVATVNVSRVAGTWAPNPAVLFSAPTINGSVDSLVITGNLRPNSRLRLLNNQVELVSPTGMMLILD